MKEKMYRIFTVSIPILHLTKNEFQFPISLEDNRKSELNKQDVDKLSFDFSTTKYHKSQQIKIKFICSIWFRINNTRI